MVKSEKMIEKVENFGLAVSMMKLSFLKVLLKAVLKNLWSCMSEIMRVILT